MKHGLRPWKKTIAVNVHLVFSRNIRTRSNEGMCVRNCIEEHQGILIVGWGEEENTRINLQNLAMISE